MACKTMLLFAPLMALSLVLGGCAGLRGGLLHSDYTMEHPEHMKFVLPGGDWNALRLLEEEDAEVIAFYRDSGRVSVSISASTEGMLRVDSVNGFEPNDPDSVKVFKKLQNAARELQSGDSAGVAAEPVMTSAGRGHVCLSDNERNRCSFVVHTKRGNWVFAEVVTPKEESAEDLGRRVLSKVDEGVNGVFYEKKGDGSGSGETRDKHETRKFKSTGLGMSIWYNWEDEDLNPERDFSRAVLLRRSGLIDFGGSLGLNYVNLYGFNPGDAWKDWGWRYMFLLGFRLYFAKASVSPFLGAQIGLGMQYDDHYSDFRDKFAINLAGGAEAGLVFCRYCKYQFELGASYDAVDDGFFDDQVFGSFNFYAAVNY